MDKIERLRAAAAAAAKRATDVASKADAENRNMTADELADYGRAMTEAKDGLEALRTAKADADVISQARALASEIGGPAEEDLEVTGKAGGVARLKNLGLEVVQSAEFKAAMSGFKDGRVPEKARFQTDPVSVKSLFTGTDRGSAGIFVTPEQTGILEMLGRRPLTIRDLVSVRRTASDTVEYVRQASHTNAAAPVPEATTSAAVGGTVTAVQAGVKPEGSWTFTRHTATVKTIAEWVPATKRALADAGQLEGLINDELRKDIAEVEENQILLGDGSGENLPGILTTSGIQTQAFDTDLFRTLRRALTKARVVGRVVPNAVGLNPEDVETIDLARENGATGAYLGAGPFALGPRTVWGLPVFESEAIPAGRGLLGDFSKAVLWDREQTTVTMTDSHADFFIRNMVAILAEERIAFGVTRPTAFVDVRVRAA